jgi:hypothetical protein
MLGSDNNSVSRPQWLCWHPGLILTLMFFVSLMLSVNSDASVCGDANGDGEINIADAVFIINYIFKGGPAPDPVDSGDANDDGAINVGDAVFLITYIFKGGPAPCSNPYGYLMAYGDCKYEHKKPALDSIPATKDCISYSYDGIGTLLLTHINGAFNCCPVSISGYVYINGNLVNIYEEETIGGDPCPCLCLYDLHYEILDLPPGEYTIKIMGLYLGDGDPIESTIALPPSPDTGMYCIERSIYPWEE